MLKLQNLTKIYLAGDNKVTALKEVNLTFRQNEFVSILGPSGCGKTTMLNIIGGLDRYTKGDLFIGGISTKDYTDRDWDTYRNDSVGFVFQNYNLIPHENVLENVELALTLSGKNKKERVEKAKQALEKVGLSDQLYKKPNQLSGGQMQRVAIARALVNDPEIVLADEPTGALDSQTSVQVMDLLKEIAQDRLVIMVTHNAELANSYSTRIINLLDGKVIGDSKPYEEKVQQQLKKKPKKKSGMNLFTSFKLSLKNLISKRTRTFLTSFAGSIGIIGIALVLSVANGFNTYISGLQQGTLASYPLTIYSSILDTNALTPDINTGSDDRVEYGDITQTGITVSKGMNASTIAKAQHVNKINQEYLDYIKNALPSSLITSISYGYGLSQNLFMKSAFNGNALKISIPTYSMEEMMVNMDLSKFMQYAESYSAANSSVNWQELLTNSDFVQSNYDTLSGKFPTEYTQVALVVNKYNQISRQVLVAMGFSDEQIDKGFTPEDFIGKHFYIVTNDDYYSTSSMTTPNGQMLTLTPTEAADYNKLLDGNNTIELTISGVIRVNSEATNALYETGIVYTPMLIDETRKIEAVSTLKTQVDASDIVIISKGSASLISSKQGLESIQMGQNTLTPNTSWTTLKQTLGQSDMPSTISFYAIDFDAKTQLIEILNNYNLDKAKEDQILFSDTTSLITSSMGTVVDAISYVLITFAAISLVVSSIMIGIITYVSVVERTREIGVLRALGARKRDIKTVFISETFTIGLVAGLIGILVSYLLTFAINAIVGHFFAALNTLAQLNPLHALILVVVSFALTMIAGLIPSSIAAKKDPVIALRTE